MASKIYFFRGANYVQIDADSSKVDSGYPRSIAEDWHGLKAVGFDSDLDDAVYFNNTLYFYKKGKYVEYKLEKDNAVGDARPLSKLFKNLPAEFQSGFNASIIFYSHATDANQLWLLKNDDTTMSSAKSGDLDFNNSTHKLSWQGAWSFLPKAFLSGVDAGFAYYSSTPFVAESAVFFFQKNQTAKYGHFECDPAKPINDVWKGLNEDFADGIDAAVQLPTEKKISNGPVPSPTLKTGRQCCFDLPPNTTFYVAAMNTEQWVRTVHVTIDGKEAKPVNLPAHDNGLVQVYKSGAGSSGKSAVCIGIDDSESGHMLLGWYPPVVVADGEFVNIGAEKDYRKETGFNDAAVCVYWRKN